MQVHIYSFTRLDYPLQQRYSYRTVLPVLEGCPNWTWDNCPHAVTELLWQSKKMQNSCFLTSWSIAWSFFFLWISYEKATINKFFIQKGKAFKLFCEKEIFYKSLLFPTKIIQIITFSLKKLLIVIFAFKQAVKHYFFIKNLKIMFTFPVEKALFFMQHLKYSKIKWWSG